MINSVFLLFLTLFEFESSAESAVEGGTRKIAVSSCCKKGSVKQACEARAEHKVTHELVKIGTSFADDELDFTIVTFRLNRALR